MNRELLPDDLWRRVAPLLPRHRRSREGGRPCVDGGAALRGLLFDLKTGITWEDLPAEAFGGSGITCRRRFDEGTRARVFWRLHQQLLEELGLDGRIDWSRAGLDSGSVRARKGGTRRAATPRIAGETGRSTTS